MGAARALGQQRWERGRLRWIGGITGEMAILIFRYFDSSFLRMRRSSMKFSAVIAHSTDPNEIITIMSIGRGLLPRLPL
jgi:hypothetical protein